MSDTIKSVLRMIPYGFYAITSRNGDEVNAMVANWLTQVSFEPRLVALGLAKSAHSHSIISAGQVFGVMLFHQDDKDAIMPFTKGMAKNPDKMKAAKYTEAPETGVPVLEGASAYLEVRVKEIIDVGGDHDIVIGEVVGAGINKELTPTEVLSLPALGWSYAG